MADENGEGQLPFVAVALEERPGAWVVRCQGEIDLESSAQLRDALATPVEVATDRVIVDLASVNFIDSSGLSTLLAAYKRLHETGRALVLRGPQPRVQRVFAVAGLESVFQIEE